MARTRKEASEISAAISKRVAELMGMVFGQEVLNHREFEPELWNGHYVYTFEHAAGTERMIMRWRDAAGKEAHLFKDEFTIRTLSDYSYASPFVEMGHIMKGEFSQMLYLQLKDGKVIEDWYIVNLYELRRWLHDNITEVMARQKLNEVRDKRTGLVGPDGSGYVPIRRKELPNGVITQAMENYRAFGSYILGQPMNTAGAL